MISALFKAAQLLGLLGVITRIRLRLLPAYRLHERITWTTSFDRDYGAAGRTGVGQRRRFEFFWLPRFDASAMKTLNTTDADIGDAEEPAVAAPLGSIERYTRPERVDWSYRIYASERTVKFVEMEFAVPIANGPDCFREAFGN